MCPFASNTGRSLWKPFLGSREKVPTGKVLPKPFAFHQTRLEIGLLLFLRHDDCNIRNGKTIQKHAYFLETIKSARVFVTEQGPGHYHSIALSDFAYPLIIRQSRFHIHFRQDFRHWTRVGKDNVSSGT